MRTVLNRAQTKCLFLAFSFLEATEHARPCEFSTNPDSLISAHPKRAVCLFFPRSERNKMTTRGGAQRIAPARDTLIDLFLNRAFV